MRLSKKERQKVLKATIDETPFITDEELAKKFNVSIQTIRLDRLELSIPELRERIKDVAKAKLNEEVKSLQIEEIIGDIVDLEMEKSAISIFDVKKEHVFTRNPIARGHHLFAQANSLAVALLDEELALTAKANVKFTRQVRENERVVAKAKVIANDEERHRTTVLVQSYVGQELAFIGEFEMYRPNKWKKAGSINENSN
ncbi:transcription factor FapR [Calidifontibacillus erzurumensis]|uniref:Transcription factor FapR n=1 Tax=Calidifontibacillus erzurumensis TaxID=2741433 RepID=A0A8J8KDY7_9BACI|nr:transcription factor FapR [Calidifontibacillus erzurumensis]NSL51220.1 transcription factor FapR [Calidifontibacillus erzurumensis]